MKKFLNVLTSSAILSLSLSQIAMANDEDVTNHPLYGGIEEAIERGIIDDNLQISPNSHVTRAEFASMIVKATGATEISNHNFSDVPSSHPYYEDIQRAFKSELIFGYSEDIFKPDQTISREEMALMLMRYIKKTGIDLDTVEAQSFNDIEKVKYPSVIMESRQMGIVAGYEDNTFRPNSNITKAESIAFIIRSLNKIEQKIQDEENSIIADEKVGFVTADSLNVRNLPTTDGSEIVGKLKFGEKVVITELNGDWGTIAYNDNTAYIHTGFVMFEQDNNVITPPQIETTTGYVIADLLNVRNQPNTSSSTVLGKLPSGEMVKIISVDANGWGKIFYEDGIAYVFMDFIVFNDPTLVVDEPSTETETTPELSTEEPVYFIQSRDGEKQMVGNKEQAMLHFHNSNDELVVYKDDEVIFMKDGLARTKHFSLVYDLETKQSFTYLTYDIDLDVLSVLDDKVIVSFAGFKGYLNKSDVELIPYMNGDEMAHYIRQGDYLYHKLFRNDRFETYQVGKSPDFIEPNTPVYSFDGYIFNGQEGYQYFSFFPVRIETSYTGEDLDNFIKHYSPDSPLIGYGQTFVDAAKKYKMNALYLLAHAIHESAWGKSYIARTKNNLFGFRATDDDPVNNAASFETLEEGIEFSAKYISDKYLTPGGWIYKGGILGNKNIGMNVKYASDPYWGAKIANYMNKADELLGGKEKNMYEIGIIDEDAEIFAVVENQKTTLPKINGQRYIAIKEMVELENKSYYKLFSDDLQYEYIYVSPEYVRKIKTY